MIDGKLICQVAVKTFVKKMILLVRVDSVEKDLMLYNWKSVTRCHIYKILNDLLIYNLCSYFCFFIYMS